MEEEVDIDPELRRWLVEMHQQLDRLTHYDLLGLHRNADAADIKRAYVRIAGIVHPDRFFTKRVGPYKPMIDAIFTRASEAHDTLRVAEKRAEYDKALDAFWKLSISLNGLPVVVKGKGVDGARFERAAKEMKKPELRFLIDLGLGKGRDRVLTCDLTDKYVFINAEYPT